MLHNCSAASACMHGANNRSALQEMHMHMQSASELSRSKPNTRNIDKGYLSTCWARLCLAQKPEARVDGGQRDWPVTAKTGTGKIGNGQNFFSENLTFSSAKLMTFSNENKCLAHLQTLSSLRDLSRRRCHNLIFALHRYTTLN